MFLSRDIEPMLKNENLSYIAQNHLSITILEYLVHRWKIEITAECLLFITSALKRL